MDKNKLQAQAASWQNARELSSEIALWELNPIKSAEEIEALIQQADIPKQATQVLLERLDSKQAILATDLQDHCLDFEIAMGIESPTEDKAARMAFQIKRLQENMGKTQPSRQVVIEQSQLTWFGLTASEASYAQYQTRFFDSLKRCEEGQLENA